MSRAALLLLLACGCGPKPAPPDAVALLGEWIVTDFRAPGGGEDRGQLRMRARVSEGTWSQQFLRHTFEDFEYALDPTQSPKHLDLTYTDPTGRRLVARAIYDLRGDDLRVCLGSPPVVVRDGKAEYAESVRPTAFVASAGALYLYRRAGAK